VAALASPASLKGVLAAPEAATALAEGFRSQGVEARELPVADGGEGTAAVLAAALGGEWHDATVSGPLGSPVDARWLLLPGRTAVVESSQAIGLALVAEEERDPLRASSRGLGELIHAALEEGPDELLICLGDSATVDGGAGLMEVFGGFPVPVVAACDVRNPLLGPRGAARVFGPQKGATEEQVEELEKRLAGRRSLAPFADLPGAGAAGGLGAALAALGAELVPGAEVVLERIGFRAAARAAELVVTGEGTVDSTTLEGKAPGAVVGVCSEEGIRCAVFGGRVEETIPGAEMFELPSGPESARKDLVELGARLAELLGQSL
jgi:glycerate 2-kinase